MPGEERVCTACGDHFKPKRVNQRRCGTCVRDRVRNDEVLAVKSAPTRAGRLNVTRALDIDRSLREREGR